MCIEHMGQHLLSLCLAPHFLSSWIKCLACHKINGAAPQYVLRTSLCLAKVTILMLHPSLSVMDIMASQLFPCLQVPLGPQEHKFGFSLRFPWQLCSCHWQDKDILGHPSSGRAAGPAAQ